MCWRRRGARGGRAVGGLNVLDAPVQRAGGRVDRAGLPAGAGGWWRVRARCAFVFSFHAPLNTQVLVFLFFSLLIISFALCLFVSLAFVPLFSFRNLFSFLPFMISTAIGETSPSLKDGFRKSPTGKRHGNGTTTKNQLRHVFLPCRTLGRMCRRAKEV